ncbi:MAG: hypothetical protein H0X37_01675 [Herpetosiphonaceae bacterium]|nr:hypothetical protein [Herpetosiphonaceae bacterium]
MRERRPAHFIGVRTYEDPKGRFYFRYPTDWAEFELDDNREGIMYVPEAEDLVTNFSAWVSELDHPVVAEDLEDLRQGVDAGLASLTECNVEAESQDALGNLVKFERIFTFHEGDAIRKRKLWILYVDKWLIVLTFQGYSEEAYDHWLAMANYSFDTFNIPAELWFSVDRDLSGYTRS